LNETILVIEKLIDPKYLLFAKYLFAYMGVFAMTSWLLNVGWGVLIHNKSLVEANNDYDLKISTWLVISLVLAQIHLKKLRK
jgi:hypothetical protein